MKMPEGFDGPTMEIEIKDSKLDQAGLTGYVKEFFGKNLKDVKKVGFFSQNDTQDGQLSETVEAELKASYSLNEMQDFMLVVHKTKIEPEVANVKIASQFAEWSMRKMRKEIEHCIESDIQIKHSKITNNIERMIDNPDKINDFVEKVGIKDSKMLEYPIPVLLQSGSKFQLNKFSIESDSEKL